MEWLSILAIILLLIGPISIVLIYILIIRAICKYTAKQNAEAFNYDYLAIRIAEETCKRLMIIEGQKAYSAATHAAEAQGTGNRVGAPEMDESPQE